MKFIARLYDKKIDASGLAVFRVFYCFVLLCEVIQLFYFRHLVFDKIPYLEPSEIDFSIPLILWMAIIVLIVLGFFTRTATILNYLLSIVFFATTSTYEYHMFYAYMGVNFLLMFTSISKVGSLDALLIKLKYSNTRTAYQPSRDTSVLNYFIYPLVGVAFVYFDSIFYKFASYNWTHGLGMWLPASLPQVTHLGQSSFISESKILSLFLGYLTFAFEAIFLFTFFRKKWRLPLLAIGIGLHIGIAIEFPLPWFGLGVCALYMTMVPVSCWKGIKNRLTFKQKKLLIYYDEECPLCNRTRIILTHLDFFNALIFKGVQTYGFKDNRLEHIDKDNLLNSIYSLTHTGKLLRGIDTYKYAFKWIPIFFPVGIFISVPGIYHLAKGFYKKVAENRHVERCTEQNCGYTPPSFPVKNDDIKVFKTMRVKDLRLYVLGFCFFVILVFQINVTYNSLLLQNARDAIGITESKLEHGIQMLSKPLHRFSKVFLGITTHGVFMDSHFDGYNHIVALEANLTDGRKIWLPIVDQEGNPDLYAYSFNWVKWTFRVNNRNINQEQLKRGIRDFTAFWAFKNRVSLNNVKFLVKVKKVRVPRKWEENFLERQTAKPWISGGYVEWKNNEFYPSVKEIEKL